MTPKPSAAPGRLVWSKLSPDRRDELLTIAQRIVKRESPRLQDRYGTSVLGLGVGFRTKGKDQKVRREIVIRVFVEKKWRKAKKPGKKDQPIPPYFVGYAREDNRRVEVKIPTDVNELKAFELQGMGLQGRWGSAFERGSACCVLRDQESRKLYVLSCNHMIGLMTRTNDCKGKVRTLVDLLYGPDVELEKVGSIEDRVDIAPVHADKELFSLDAAIATITPGTVPSTINGARPRRVLRSYAGIRPGLRLHIPARSRNISASVVGFPLDLRLPYRCPTGLVYLRFRRLIEYRASPATRGGDSGSAVLHGDTLVGMHFGSRVAGYGLAMCAGDVIKRTIFNRRLKLT